MYGYIYRITDTLTGKLYIGQHRYEKPELDPSYHGSGHIIKRIYHKRPETLLTEIIFIAETEDELNYFERYFIEHLNTLHPNGYNLNTGGYRPKLSKRSKLKISRSHKEIMTPERRQQISEATKKAMTPEVCKKVSEARKGKPAWNKGKAWDEETKKKISEANKGHVSANKGKPCPEHVKEAISKANKGRESWRKGKTKVPVDEIYNYYIINKLTYKEIASLYNCTAKYIRNFIKRYIKKECK